MKRFHITRLLAMLLTLCMLLPLGIIAESESTAPDNYKYNIVHLDCGRKYFSAANIKKLIDTMSGAGFTHLELAIGNDGMRFLLDDMSLTVNGTSYSSDTIKKGIQNGNKTYYDAGTYNELTEKEMDEIISYAFGKGIEIIPLINTPGHMDSIQNCIEEATGQTVAYDNSDRTIDVTNTTAVAFTKVFLQKYITYFANKGCTLFNMGADEYANDVYTSGGMGFGNLISNRKYNYFVNYVNEVAAMIKEAGMKPIAFNDGIYYNGNTGYGTFDTDILISYWSNGWSGYYPAASSFLRNKGFDLINTNGSYYWVLGKSDAQCSASKASGFTYTAFPDGTISDPAGSMFAIWCDYPGADTDTNVINNTSAVVTAFGGALPKPAKKMATVYNDSKELSVTGYDLTSVTVTPVAAVPSIPSASKVALWDVVPYTSTGKYYGSAVISLKIPEDWDSTAKIRAFCINDDSTMTLGITGTVKNGWFTFTAPHFSQWGIYQVADGVTEVTENRTITVVKGGKAYTDRIDGINYTETPTPESPDMVTVTAKGTTTEGKHYYELVTNGASGIKAGEKYLIVYRSSGTSNSGYALTATGGRTSVTISNGQIASADANAVFTLEASGTNYYLKDANGTYLYPNATYSRRSWSYAITHESSTAQAVTVSGSSSTVTISRRVYSGTRNTDALLYYTSNNGFTASNSSSSFYLYREVTQEGESYTDVTFEGKELGTTTVTVGHVLYTIQVVEEQVEGVTRKVEFWITNRRVVAPNTTDNNYLDITAAKAYGENGAAIASLLPKSGYVAVNTDYKAVYWKTTRLTSDNEQTTEKGVDQTLNGDDFTYIRYYGGAWAISADRVTWKEIASTDQIVAYFLQVTEVTEEVTTEVVDWGDEALPSYYDDKFIFVDFAVKLQSSGELKPSTFPNYKETIVFHCDSADTTSVHKFDGVTTSNWYDYYRTIGLVKAEESVNYEVYMITMTPSSDSRTTAVASSATISSSTAKYTYEGTEKVVWVDDEKNLGDFADESLHADGYHVGGEAIVPGFNVTNRHAMLITYYVRAKATKDSLTVHYIDQNANNKEFYNYNIAVKAGTFFNENFGLVNGSLVGNTVLNYNDDTQTVSSNLSRMPEISAQYRYSEYDCVKAERSADGKHVYLYYSFKNAKTVVADFGLPLEVKLNDLNPEFAKAIIQSVNATLRTGSTALATVSQNAAGEWVIRYELTEILKGIDVVTVQVTGYNTETHLTSTATWLLYVVPATNVSYEESYFDFSGSWNTTGTAKTPSQSSENKNYGFDTVYDNSDDFSMGNAKFAYITEKNVSAADCPSATFTFTGTGFDIISACGSNTGVLYVRYKRTDGTGKAHVIMVDTYFSGTFVSNNNGSVNLDTVHQIPVVSKTDLEYAEYEVTVYAYYLKTSGAVVARRTAAIAENPDAAKNFELAENDIRVYLDGIRVYNPMGTALTDGTAYDAYAEAKELNPEYVSLYDALKKNNSNWNESDSSFIYLEKPDNETVADQDYVIGSYQENKGPYNEIYVAPGSAIAFRVNGTGDLLAISVKAINGATAMQLNGAAAIAIQSMTEQYYTVTPVNGVVVIENTGDAILSVVKIKLVGYTVAETTNAAKQELVEAVNSLLAKAQEIVTPTEPETPETPEIPETPVKPERPSESGKKDFRPKHFRIGFGTERGRGESRAFFTVRTSAEVTGILVNGKLVTDSVVEDGYKTFRVELTLGSSGIEMLVGRAGRLSVTTDEYSHRKYLNPVAARTEVVTVAAVKDGTVGEAQTVAVRY